MAQFDPALFDTALFSAVDVITFGTGLHFKKGWHFDDAPAANNELKPYLEEGAPAPLGYIIMGGFGSGSFGMGPFGYGDYLSIPVYPLETPATPIYTQE